jgi:osmotically-inducible protein OsmY
MLTSIRPFRFLLACSAPLLFMATSMADDLAARVTAQIQAAPALRGNPITVKSLGPTVWLSGNASSTQQQAAIAIARQTPGVERVVDQLSVSRPVAESAAVVSSNPQPDHNTDHTKPELATAVATALRTAGSLKGYRVSVKAKDGTVWLTGTLSSREQLQSAVSLAEQTPGVERVVNRLSVAEAAAPQAESSSLFSLPESMQSLIGLTPHEDAGVRQAAGTMEQGDVQLANGDMPVGESMGLIQLTQAQLQAVGQARYPSRSQYPTQSRQLVTRARQPMPRASGAPVGRPLPMRMAARPQRGSVRPAGYGEPMVLPGPNDYAEYATDGQMVPGSMQITEGGMALAEGGMPMSGGPGMGQPMPMGGSGVGMPAVPVRGGGPNMPNYAWPSYAANPNYAALQYPTQYSPTAWPYIGPFYPYPQVPLGWRRVSLEWDDGWWFLDFDERHIHSHHR